MVKKSLWISALVVALIPFAGLKAADQKDIRQTPQPYSMTAQQAPRGTLTKTTKPPAATYCDPGATTGCLFYSGDINPNDENDNGLVNGCTTIFGVSCSGNDNTALEILAPFVVPSGQTWTVTSVFSNALSTDSGTIDSGLSGDAKSICYWGIFTGVSSGVKGTLVREHVNPCTSTATGRNAFGFNEYQVLITFPTTEAPVVLTAGTYFLTAQPECTNTADSNCDAEWFESDAENTQGNGTQGPLINAFGTPAPNDDAFEESSVFGFTYSPTWGSSGACGGIGCDQFSDGLLGTCTGSGCPK